MAKRFLRSGNFFGLKFLSVKSIGAASWSLCPRVSLASASAVMDVYSYLSQTHTNTRTNTQSANKQTIYNCWRCCCWCCCCCAADDDVRCDDDDDWAYLRLDSHFGDNIYLGFTKNQSQWICGRLFQPFCCRRRRRFVAASCVCVLAFNRWSFYDFDWHTIYDIRMEFLLHIFRHHLPLHRKRAHANHCNLWENIYLQPTSPAPPSPPSPWPNQIKVNPVVSMRLR